jgi:outer membrane protein
MTASTWARFGLFAALAVGLASTASAQQATAPSQLKVGVVNLQKALQDSAEIKQAEIDLKARFGPRQDELLALEKELTKLQQESDANQGKYTDAAMAEIAGKIQMKQRQLQRNSEALQESVNRERQDILQRVGQRLQEVVKKVAEEKGLDMVLDAANLLFTKPVYDISAEVTAAYDKAYPVKK